MERTFEKSDVILSSPHLRIHFSSVLKKIQHYTSGCKYVFVSFRNYQFLTTLIYCTPGRAWKEAGGQQFWA